ncbi:Uncharacterized protein BM_BM10928 [Brugia malayi]|uniref:Apple domain-containing protein n=1 Tax=Brugia malayi TaxID=6279 RepID=A0A4E9EQP9_BRUMA|nr:Uncharacterized protein BM_BM10928 [Brugia malayi]VIO86281.1 Uncharacterized protein BM_BM10928 [Brugia malayi]
MLAIIFACLLQSANGQYSSITESSVNVTAPQLSYGGSESSYVYTKPTVPAAPPRVPVRDEPSLGYRPPPPPIRRDAKSSGKCSFDRKSWRFEPRTAIANAIMFERTTGFTCEECVRKCLHFQLSQDPNSEWMCRSLTFDHHWKICDLFAVNGTNPPHFLTEYLDRDYLEYLQVNPSSNVHLTQYSTISDADNKEPAYLTASQNTEITEKYGSDSLSDYEPVHRKLSNKSGEKLCKNEDVARYAMILNYERLNSATDMHFVKSESLKECARACDQEEMFTCTSVIHRTKECELSVSRTTDKNSDDFIFKENSTYLEKFCFSASLAKATEKLWPTVLDHILVGHVMEVVDAASLIGCMSACLQAEQKFSFLCRSAMWYPNDKDQNCLLNTENRETHPNVFVAENQGVRVFYFEIPRTRNKKEISDVFLDDPVEDDYTQWSLCNSSNVQHRYLKCKEQTDVRKCPQQTKLCKTLRASKMLRKGKCLAIRDSNGRKKCPHGMQKVHGRHTQYCKNPIDCSL